MPPAAQHQSRTDRLRLFLAYRQEELLSRESRGIITAMFQRMRH